DRCCRAFGGAASPLVEAGSGTRSPCRCSTYIECRKDGTGQEQLHPALVRRPLDPLGRCRLSSLVRPCRDRISPGRPPLEGRQNPLLSSTHPLPKSGSSASRVRSRYPPSSTALHR